MIRITFSINGLNAHLALYYAIGTIGLVLIQIDFKTMLNNSQASVYRFQMPNVSDVRFNTYCDTSYNDCRCTVALTKHCLSNTQIKVTRILPLVSFLLQLCLVRELFSLDGNYKDFFIFLLRITCVFTFITILVIVYQKPCYYNLLSTILRCSGLQLFLIFAFVIMFYH